jgi:hypothetical protein
MAEFDDKSNGNTVDATEYNAIVRETRNAILDSGQTLNGSDDHQVAKGMVNCAAISTFYNDSGIANTYTLNPQTSFNAPTSLINGLEVRFRPANNNTGASTIQPLGLPAKAAKKADKVTDVSVGDISTSQDAIFRYDSANDVWVQSSSIANLNASTFQQIIISNNISDPNNDIDSTAGGFIFSDYSGSTSLIALIKRLDANWAAGTNQGGLFSGSKAANTTYHYFGIYNPTTGVADAGFDTSIVAANKPSGFTKYKRLGSIITDSSGNIYAFTMTRLAQGQASFKYTTNINVFTGAVPALNTDLTITTPSNLSVGALLSGTLGHSGTACWYLIKSKIEGDNVLCGALGNITNARGSVTPPFPILTNTSSQIQHGFDASLGSAGLTLNLHGWIDYQL